MVYLASLYLIIVVHRVLVLQNLVALCLTLGVSERPSEPNLQFFECSVTLALCVMAMPPSRLDFISNEYYAYWAVRTLRRSFLHLAERPGYKDNPAKLDYAYRVFSHHIDLCISGQLLPRGPLPPTADPKIVHATDCCIDEILCIIDPDLYDHVTATVYSQPLDCDTNHDTVSDSKVEPTEAPAVTVESPAPIPAAEIRFVSSTHLTTGFPPPATPPGISRPSVAKPEVTSAVGSSVLEEVDSKAINDPPDLSLALVDSCHGLTVFPGGSSSSSVVGLFVSVLCIIFTIFLVPVTSPIRLRPLPEPPPSFEPLYMSRVIFDFHLSLSTPIHLSLDHRVDDMGLGTNMRC